MYKFFDNYLIFLFFSLICIYFVLFLFLLVLLITSSTFAGISLEYYPILKKKSSWFYFQNYKKLISFDLNVTNTYKLRDKFSAYECGFMTFSDSRIPYNIHFYLIAILFLIFDLEIIFLFPVTAIIGSFYLSGFLIALNTLFIFLFILGVGLYYEYNKGVLDFLCFYDYASIK